MRLKQPTWLYHPDKGARLFKKGAAHPAGWYETPDGFPKEQPKKEVVEVKDKLAEMDKKELELYARENFGIELDRRKSRMNMLKQFEDALNDS